MDQPKSPQYTSIDLVKRHAESMIRQEQEGLMAALHNLRKTIICELVDCNKMIENLQNQMTGMGVEDDTGSY